MLVVYFMMSQVQVQHIHSQILIYSSNMKECKLKTPVRNIKTTNVFAFIITWCIANVHFLFCIPNTSIKSHLIILLFQVKAVFWIDLPLIITLKPWKTPWWLIIFNFDRKCSKKTLFTLMTKDETWNFCCWYFCVINQKQNEMRTRAKRIAFMV